jgi:hypothetical protein
VVAQQTPIQSVLCLALASPLLTFSLSDVSVSGGSLSNLSGSDKTYTATFTASGDGSKTINIAAGGFTNSSGNR